ncbi:MAG: hypothetical protein AAF404_15005 [Pseudomonadota bacterium]
MRTLARWCFLFCVYTLQSAMADVLECPADHQINATFSNGAAWHMCWHATARENIVLTTVHYQPPATRAFQVFNALSLSQLHVSYDDRNIVYNDVTQFGLGGNQAHPLDDNDCPAGQLHYQAGAARLCSTVSQGPDQYQALNGTRYAESVTVSSTSLVGAYAYLVSWKFFANGSLQPSVGAAGALQRSSDDPQSRYGRKLDGVSDKSWLSHSHDYYWRLDFDLGDTGLDDTVTELSFDTDANGRRARSEHRFTREAARAIDPQRMNSWLIADTSADMARGYLIEPVNYGHKLVERLNNPYTLYDVFITRHNDCEWFANENSVYYPDCADNALAFVNDENIQGEDIVLWHRLSFHHVPRNEDRYTMHSHWDGFTVEARNLSAVTASNVSADVLAAIQNADEPVQERRHAASGCTTGNNQRTGNQVLLILLAGMGLCRRFALSVSSLDPQAS